ncbi:MAG: molecular chaperone DnaK [Candidatus Thermoplasmatota archaeon]|nr:molecular chaperone DnaK [Candidatus Thermoplasmatota archaeon]MCL6089520.1 molecular chaperone DnaK [Candidatus Thermoplasmatota archaeon]MDA8143502.1 molecular chaperone DnaK [Thermoplasmatales archaeon]
MSKIIGIDLGTSNSAAAVVISGKPTVIPSAEGVSIGGKSFPSYVAFTKEGDLLVGEPAKRQALLNPEGTIYAAKRKMGTDFKFKVRGKEYTPQQVSAFILQKIKRDAEAFLGEEVKEAVITVPAYFNDNQRQATKDAGLIAGLEVKRIINEPTAASLAYGIDKLNQSQKILVFDLGGGTLDVTIMDFGEGVFEVVSTSGDTSLGGTDMDEAIIKFLVDDFKAKEGVDLSKDKNAYIRLKDAAEKAKIELSTTMTTEINLPYITATQDGPKHLQYNLTRSKLEELILPIVNRCKSPIDTAIQSGKLKKDEVGKIILVGGPTRIPMVRKFVEDYFGRKVEGGVDPMECVSVGAAIQGAVLSGDIKDIVLLDVTPLTLGIETLGGVMTPLIAANTTIPTKKSQIFSTAADMQTAVTIHVVQGERAMANDNVSLGMFNLVGIPPAPRGIPQIEVTFDIDANGIINVSAADKGSGKSQSISITASNKLSKEEIEKMKNQAKEFAEQDKQKKEEVEKANTAETLAYTVEKTINESGDKIDEASKNEVKEQVKELREAIAAKDSKKIESLSETLSKKIQEIGAKLYQNPGSPDPEAATGQQQSGSEQQQDTDGKTVDADFKEN